MSDIAIEVRNLEKIFRIYPDLVKSRIKQVFCHKKKFYQEKVALQDINLTIKQGEVIGILGPNGAGKTTLLKIIAGISYPTHGEVYCNGKVSAVLALGLGFHPRLSGLENIEMAGMMLGMTRAEVKNKLDWIIDFSELGEYIDRPMTTYSSGMKARLSFAVAACQEPEILIIDEALATGDIRFVQKCIKRIHDITLSGSTALFVSHNVWSIKKLASRTILIDGGRLVDDGETSVVADHYYEVMLKNEVLEKHTNVYDYTSFVGSGEVKLSNISMFDKDGKTCTIVNAGETVSVMLELESLEYFEIGLALTCWRDDGIVATISSGLAGGNLNESHDFCENSFHVKPGFNKIIFEYRPLLLAPGDFYFDLQIFDAASHSGYTSNQQFYFKTHILDFGVRKYKNPNRSIVFYQPASIYLREEDATI